MDSAAHFAWALRCSGCGGEDPFWLVPPWARERARGLPERVRHGAQARSSKRWWSMLGVAVGGSVADCPERSATGVLPLLGGRAPGRRLIRWRPGLDIRLPCLRLSAAHNAPGSERVWSDRSNQRRALGPATMSLRSQGLMGFPGIPGIPCFLGLLGSAST